VHGRDQRRERRRILGAARLRRKPRLPKNPEKHATCDLSRLDCPGALETRPGPLLGYNDEGQHVAFEIRIESDSATLATLVEHLRQALAGDAPVLRGPPTGGLASALNEMAAASGVGIQLDDPAVAVPAEVLRTSIGGTRIVDLLPGD
jgi:hypothetical protein